MASDLIWVGDVELSGVRVTRYSQEIRHKGLKEHRVFSSTDEDVLDHKVEQQIAKWTEKWEKVLQQKDTESRSEDAALVFVQLENILSHTLKVDDKVDWKKLKKREQFKDGRPEKPEPPISKQYPRIPARDLTAINPTQQKHA